MLIDHVELARAAKAFLQEGHDLAITINTLLGKIDDLGDVYGDDDAGRQAKKAFDKARDNVAGYSGAICAAYTGVGHNLDLMNANVDVANWASTVELPAVETNVPRFGR
jgi:hypothetical protein